MEPPRCLKRMNAFTEDNRPKRGSFSEVEDSLQNKATDIYKGILPIYAKVKAVSITRWSSLDSQLDEHTAYAKVLFTTLITSRCPDYAIQHPTSENAPCPPLEKSNTLPLPQNPSNAEQGKSKLETYLDRLVVRLKKYQTRLLSDALHAPFKALTQFEIVLWNHYSPKVPKLPLSCYWETKEELLSDLPEREFKLLSKIKTELLSQSERTRRFFNLLFFHAQEIYDHYKATWSSHASCVRKLDVYTKGHCIYLRQLLEAKHQRRFKDEEEAQNHVAKLQHRCEKQQRLQYDVPNPEWDKPEFETLPVVDCSLKRLSGHTYCMGSHKGGRLEKPTIEDHVLATAFSCKIEEEQITISLFGVFDGHGGDKTAIHCKEHLPELLKNTLEMHLGKGIRLNGIFNAVKEVCLKLHQTAPNISGTTALFAFCIQDDWYIASVGDSRGIIIHDSPIAMTYDASAADPYFQEKVSLRGGKMYFNKGVTRVDGTLRLSLTNTLGDKIDELLLTQTPTINVFQVPKNAEKKIYLLLCSDGVINKVSHQQLFDFIRNSEKRKIGMKAFTTSILQKAAALNSGPVGDDVSIIMVKLN